MSDVDLFFRDRGFVGLGSLGNVDVLILLYAENIVILADTLVDANRKLLTLREYCSLNKMTVNIDKKKVIIFKRSRIDINNYEDKLRW